MIDRHGAASTGRFPLARAGLGQLRRPRVRLSPHRPCRRPQPQRPRVGGATLQTSTMDVADLNDAVAERYAIDRSRQGVLLLVTVRDADGNGIAPGRPAAGRDGGRLAGCTGNAGAAPDHHGGHDRLHRRVPGEAAGNGAIPDQSAATWRARRAFRRRRRCIRARTSAAVGHGASVKFLTGFLMTDFIGRKCTRSLCRTVSRRLRQPTRG